MRCSKRHAKPTSACNLFHEQGLLMLKRTHRLAPMILAAALLMGCAPEAPEAPSAVERTGAGTAQAAVAMPDTHSARVSAEILKAGGNAVDAAIAAAFTLAVTLPEAGNIGGGGFMLVHMDGESAFLDYRETAPALADRDMYLGEDGEVITDSTLVGPRSVGIPSTVAGLWAAHQRYGTLPWAELLQPAIALARDGFLVPKHLADQIAEGVENLEGRTNFSTYFGPAAKAGHRLLQPELAHTLERIATDGRDGFYLGKTAELLVAEMERGGGLITFQDLASYEAVWREPLSGAWRGQTVVSAPPPSSGGFALLQLLRGKDLLAEHFEGLAHNSAPYVHLVAELEKRVFADRAEYLGDPAFVDIPIAALLADDYIERRATEVQLDRISAFDSVHPGLAPATPPAETRATLSAMEPADTTHFSIVDAAGNAVSNTYTINWSFGSGVVVEGAGFLLNNEMDDFSAKAGTPNIFGVVGNTANEIQPGKRMLSSMTPTLLLDDAGKVTMVIGTPGGSTIFTSVFQVMVNILDFDMSPEDAVAATRFHHQLLPPDLITHSWANPLSDAVKAELAELGYRTEKHLWEFGNVQVIVRGRDGWQAASDPRGRGESQVLKVEARPSEARP